MLFTEDLRQDFAVSRPVVKVQQHDLLPGPEQELALAKGHGQVRLEQRGPDMRKAIAILPAEIMQVFPVFRHNLLDNFSQVRDDAGFIFDGGDAGGGPGDENRGQPRGKTRGPDRVLRLAGEVHRVAEPSPNPQPDPDLTQLLTATPHCPLGTGTYF